METIDRLEKLCEMDTEGVPVVKEQDGPEGDPIHPPPKIEQDSTKGMEPYPRISRGSPKSLRQGWGSVVELKNFDGPKGIVYMLAHSEDPDHRPFVKWDDGKGGRYSWDDLNQLGYNHDLAIKLRDEHLEKFGGFKNPKNPDKQPGMLDKLGQMVGLK